jgi:phage replication-related protein YjqB (UPF0714/DUF867 family)
LRSSGDGRGPAQPRPSDGLRGYADLAARYVEGVDYAIHTFPKPSDFAVVAPHGGRIENGTSEIARQIAGEDHGLYLFEGLRPGRDNFDHLHLSSHLFDEPRCLDFLAGYDSVVTIHGYDRLDSGPPSDVLLGGRDEGLRRRMAAAFSAFGVSYLAQGHRYQGMARLNICNRSRRGEGLQLELSAEFRRREDWSVLVDAVRSVLA